MYRDDLSHIDIAKLQSESWSYAPILIGLHSRILLSSGDSILEVRNILQVLIDRFLNDPTIISVGITEWNSMHTTIFMYDDESFDIYLANVHELQNLSHLLADIGFEHDIYGDDISITRLNKNQFIVLTIMLDELYSTRAFDIYSYISEMKELDKLRFLLEHNPDAAYQYVTLDIVLFIPFIKLLVDESYYKPQDYERILKLGDIFLDYIVIQHTHIIDKHNEIIEEYKYENGHTRLKLDQEGVIIDWLDYRNLRYSNVNVEYEKYRHLTAGALKREINYYLALILIGKPIELTKDDRFKLLKYLFAAHDYGDAERLRSRYFIDFLGMPMMTDEKINPDTETMIKLGKKWAICMGYTPKI